jgi:hypothetical protein
MQIPLSQDTGKNRETTAYSFCVMAIILFKSTNIFIVIFLFIIVLYYSQL